MSAVAVNACPTCSSPTSIDARFCGECGTPCGTGKPQTSRASAQPFAAAAGAAIPTGAPPVTRSTTAARSDSMTWVALLMAVGGVFLCGPFSTVPGCFLAWREMSAAKAAGTPSTLATIALIANAALTVLGIIGFGLMALLLLAGLATA